MTLLAQVPVQISDDIIIKIFKHTDTITKTKLNMTIIFP